MRVWQTFVFKMWYLSKQVPEYRFGWKDKVAARTSLEKIQDWNFDKTIISHGVLFKKDPQQVARTTSISEALASVMAQ